MSRTAEILERVSKHISFVQGQLSLAEVGRSLTKMQVTLWKKLLQEAIEELEKL